MTVDQLDLLRGEVSGIKNKETRRILMEQAFKIYLKDKCKIPEAVKAALEDFHICKMCKELYYYEQMRRCDVCKRWICEECYRERVIVDNDVLERLYVKAGWHPCSYACHKKLYGEEYDTEYFARVRESTA